MHDIVHGWCSYSVSVEYLLTGHIVTFSLPQILLLSEDLSHPDYIRRELLVESQPDSEPEDVPRPSRSRSRRVTHFQFVTWPDFGVPEGPSGVLALLEAAQAARDEAADDDHHDGDTTEQREESSPSEQNSVECHNVSSSKSPTSLLNRVKKKLEEDDGKKNKESDHPILVHCSAGIGKEGKINAAYEVR